jgi:hypothetical protein
MNLRVSIRGRGRTAQFSPLPRLRSCARYAVTSKPTDPTRATTARRPETPTTPASTRHGSIPYLRTSGGTATTRLRPSGVVCRSTPSNRSPRARSGGTNRTWGTRPRVQTSPQGATMPASRVQVRVQMHPRGARIRLLRVQVRVQMHPRGARIRRPGCKPGCKRTYQP